MSSENWSSLTRAIRQLEVEVEDSKLLDQVLKDIHRVREKFKKLISDLESENKEAIIQQLCESINWARKFYKKNTTPGILPNQFSLLPYARKEFGLNDQGDESYEVSDKDLLIVLAALNSVRRWQGDTPSGYMESKTKPDFKETDLEHSVKMIELYSSILKAVPILSQIDLNPNLIRLMILAHDLTEVVVGDISHGQNLDPDYRKIFKTIEELVGRLGRLDNKLEPFRAKAFIPYEDRVAQLNLEGLFVKFLDKLDALLTINQIFYSGEEEKQWGDLPNRPAFRAGRIANYRRMWQTLSELLTGVKISQPSNYQNILQGLVEFVIHQSPEEFHQAMINGSQNLQPPSSGNDVFTNDFYQVAREIQLAIEEYIHWDRIAEMNSPKLD